MTSLSVKSQKLQWVDAMRALAILGVLIIHCGAYGNNAQLPLIAKVIVWSGKHGVQMFFVASAFTLFLSLNSNYKTEGNFYFQFLTRRFFRIAPMSYIGIICYLCLLI